MVQALEYLSTAYKILRVNWLARVCDTQAMKHNQLSINDQSISAEVNNQCLRKRRSYSRQIVRACHDGKADHFYGNHTTVIVVPTDRSSEISLIRSAGGRHLIPLLSFHMTHRKPTSFKHG